MPNRSANDDGAEEVNVEEEEELVVVEGGCMHPRRGCTPPRPARAPLLLVTRAL